MRVRLQRFVSICAHTLVRPVRVYALLAARESLHTLINVYTRPYVCLQTETRPAHTLQSEHTRMHAHTHAVVSGIKPIRETLLLWLHPQLRPFLTITRV